jgi:hypothetical protein
MVEGLWLNALKRIFGYDCELVDALILTFVLWKVPADVLNKMMAADNM